MSDTSPTTIPANLVEPSNVIEAIRRVMLDLPGIGKMMGEDHKKRSGGQAGGGERGITYAYRSIEQITGEAQSLFAHHGVVFVPRVLTTANQTERIIELLTGAGVAISPEGFGQVMSNMLPDPSSIEREFTMGNAGTRWTDTYLTVEYTIYGPGGTDDHITAGPFLAVGRDNSDKGFNKAMTQAFKQCLLQLLSIGDPQDEGEHQRHEQDGFRPGAQPLPRENDGTDQRPWYEQWGYVDEDEMRSMNDSLGDILKGVTTKPARELVRKWAADHWYVKDHGGDLGVTAAPTPVRKKDVEAARECFTAARTMSSEGVVLPDPEPVDPEPLAEGTPGDPPQSQDTPSASLPAPETAGPVESTESTPSGGLTEADIPPGIPDSVTDEIIGEVRLVKVPELKEELRQHGQPVGGNQPALQQRLTIAKLVAWAGSQGSN